MKTYEQRPTIAIDFDGVIHSHTSDFEHPEIIADPPVEGAFGFIRTALAAGRHVVIHTARMNASDDENPEDIRNAIRRWMLSHGLAHELVNRLRITHEKVGAAVYIDDRGWRFEGKFPTLEEIDALQQWNKRPAVVCGIKTRGEGGVDNCGASVTHVVYTSFGKRLCCEVHASAFAGQEGFLVRPIDDVCDKCGAINKSKKIGIYCWCGSAAEVERVNVDGLWYAVCKLHRPPPLWSLWRRQLQKIANRIRDLFRRPSSETEMIRLAVDAKKKARSR